MVKKTKKTSNKSKQKQSQSAAQGGQSHDNALQEERMMSLNEAIELAEEKYREGRFGICRNVLQQVLASAPNHAQAQNLLGATFYSLGNFEASAEQWEKFAETGKNNAAADSGSRSTARCPCSSAWI